jgi:hypothetical protein
MRFLVLALFSLALSAQAPGEPEVAQTVQRLFDAMSAKDATAARSLFLPGTAMIAIRTTGKITTSTSEEFATHLAAAKEAWLERMWTPQIMIRGNIATLWAPYDFHLGGKFSHCGIDSVSLAKTEGGWKIATISYTVETEGCPASPLGPIR